MKTALYVSITINNKLNKWIIMYNALHPGGFEVHQIAYNINYYINIINKLVNYVNIFEIL